MHKGRIALFETDLALVEDRARAIRMFSENEHRVVTRATDIEEASHELDQIARGEVKANVIVFDAGLLPNVNATRYAKKINKKIGELGTRVRTIGIFSESPTEVNVQVDAFLVKGSPVIKILQVIDNLPEPETKK